jgi:hypothetical protein
MNSIDKIAESMLNISFATIIGVSVYNFISAKIRKEERKEENYNEKFSKLVEEYE